MSRLRLARLLTALLTCTCLLSFGPFCKLARSQFDANLGRVEGIVSGPDGLPLPGTDVVVAGVDSGLERSASCDVTGRYRVGSLPPGDYTIIASGPGFAPNTA